MKIKTLALIIFSIYPFYLFAQETIMLDGKVLIKKDFNQYQPYEIDDTNQAKESNLKSGKIGDDKKISSMRVFTSKDYKSFAQSTIYEHKDSGSYYLPSSNLKFFDDAGKLKWEKNWEGKGPRTLFLSPDGKYNIVNMVVFATDPTAEINSLEIFDNQGNSVFTETSPVKFQLSNSRDIVCYKKNEMFTDNPEYERTIYSYDLKSKKIWTKSFDNYAEVSPISSNGDFILTYSDEIFTLLNRKGNEIFKRHRDLFGRTINAVSNDGKYVLSIQSSAIELGYFDIYRTKTMQRTRTEYFNVVEARNPIHRIYNGGCFVNNSKYIIALTSIIANNTAMIVFHNLNGEYLGHQIYNDIPSSFYYPEITLLDDGSFEIYMDGYYLGNLKLSSSSTLKYFKK